MITVLRLGHRRGRDARISTHAGLTARQFGADRIIYSGEEDVEMLKSVKDVVERWGGSFTATYREDWRRAIKDFDGVTVQMTMYGRPYQQHLSTVEDRDLMLVVGAEKVPAAVYDLVNYNLAVGHQPHSEIAALAVFLHDLHGGAELGRTFDNASIEVVPQDAGKKTRDPR